MVTSRRARAALSIAVVLPACSVLLDEPDLSASNCTSHRDCAPLNRREGLTQSCEPYQCSGSKAGADGGRGPGRCVRATRDDDDDGDAALRCGGDDCDDADDSIHAGAPEICDAKDNDCNGVIDEGTPDGPVIDPVPLATIDTRDDVERVTYAHDERGRALAVWTRRTAGVASAMVAPLEDGGMPQPFALQVPRQDTPDILDLDAAFAEGCRAWNPSPPPAVRGHVIECGAAELALGFAGETWLSAAVAELGDARGQLRVGSRQPSQRAGLVMPGPAARSNSYLGVDIDTLARPGETPQGETTGQSRKGGVLGAARPALAVLATEPTAQALVAWLGDRPSRDACATDAVPVEAVVAYLEEDRGASWLSTTTQESGSAQGAPRVVPRVLGQAAEGVGPAVLAWPQRGYFVAYGAASGGVALHFLPTAPEPPPFSPCPALACDGDAPRTMPRLGAARSTELAAMGSANGVALAGTPRGGAFDLGIAWREGCGDGGERIAFRRLEVRLDGAEPAIAQQSDALTIDGPGAYGPPSLTYVASGFERPAADGPAAELGGWVIAYRDGGAARIVARRIGERDTTLLDRGRAITLGTGVAAGELATRPWLYREEPARVRFAYFDGDGAVIAGRVSCEP